LKNLISLLRRSLSADATSKRPARRSVPLALEALEQRDVPAAITLPTNLTGGNGAVWSGFTSDDTDGFHLTDAQLGTLVNAFDNFWTLSVNGSLFNPGTNATLTTDTVARTLQSGTVQIDGLNVSQQFMVFRNGPVMRVLVKLQNATAETVEASISLNGNLGADTATTIGRTSSGDATFTTADRWVIFGGGTNIPVSSIIIGGPGASAEKPTAVAGAAGDDVFATSYDVSLRAGQTRYLMFYTRLNDTVANAASQITRFDNNASVNEGKFLRGLTLKQRREILNWNIQPHYIVVGSGAGTQPLVQVRNGFGQFLYTLQAYESGFQGGVHVAMGDINGDTVPEIIVAPGAGRGPEVRIFNAFTGKLVRSFNAFDPGYRGGVNIATGDVNGDGAADIIVGMGVSAASIPQVKAFDGRTGDELFRVLAYDNSFTGGVRVASADFNNDGFDDIITAPGAGINSKVRGLDSTKLSDADDENDELFNFNAYDDGMRAGVFVNTGDFNGDGTPDIITGTGSGVVSNVKTFNGINRTQLRSFQPHDDFFTGGVRVAAADLNGDGAADLVLGGGPGQISSVNVLNGRNNQFIRAFRAFIPAYTNGVFLAAY
jgi:hypothetical protein